MTDFCSSPCNLYLLPTVFFYFDVPLMSMMMMSMRLSMRNWAAT